MRLPYFLDWTKVWSVSCEPDLSRPSSFSSSPLFWLWSCVDWRLSAPGVEFHFLFVGIVGNGSGTVEAGVGIGQGLRAKGRPDESMPSRKQVKRADGRGRSAIVFITKFKIPKKPLRISLPARSLTR